MSMQYSSYGGVSSPGGTYGGQFVTSSPTIQQGYVQQGSYGQVGMMQAVQQVQQQMETVMIQ